MAKYDSLPIFDSAYKLTIKIMQLVTRYPKDYKFSVGERIQKVALDILISIYHANSAQDKVRYLRVLKDEIKLLSVLCRVSWDMKFISTSDFSALIEMIQDVDKQAQGWLVSCEKLREPLCTTV